MFYGLKVENLVPVKKRKKDAFILTKFELTRFVTVTSTDCSDLSPSWETVKPDNSELRLKFCVNAFS